MNGQTEDDPQPPSNSPNITAGDTMRVGGRGVLLAIFIELDSHLFKIRFELRYVASYRGYLPNGVLHLERTVL